MAVMRLCDCSFGGTGPVGAVSPRQVLHHLTAFLPIRWRFAFRFLASSSSAPVKILQSPSNFLDRHLINDFGTTKQVPQKRQVRGKEEEGTIENEDGRKSSEIRMSPLTTLSPRFSHLTQKR